MMKTSEKIRTKGGIFTSYEWERWTQATADEVAQLEVGIDGLRKEIALKADYIKRLEAGVGDGTE